jgi:hypothetical protein
MRFPVNACDRRALILLPLLLAFLSGPRLFAQVCDTGGGKQLVDLVNRERAFAGLASLAVDDRLMRAACKHTSLLTQHKVLSHQFEEEAILPIRFAEENLRSSRQAENVAQEMDVPGAHAALMNSPEHRATILSSQYTAIGVGVMRLGNKLYVTEDFAYRLPDYSEAQAAAVLDEAITKRARASGMAAPMRKPQAKLAKMACDMALNDALDGQKAATLPAVQDVFAWTAYDLNALPRRVQSRLEQPLTAGYSLGACFAASVSHPEGVYWVVMVTY